MIDVHPQPLRIDATQNKQQVVTHVGGDTVYYKTDNTVSSTVNDGSLTVGQSLKLTSTRWFATAVARASDGKPGAANLSVQGFEVPNPDVKVVSGAPTDSDFEYTPLDGQEAIDSVAGSQYVRVGGLWTSVSTGGSADLAPGFINVVTDYGATGDGSTDDYAALNNAVTYIKANGGVMYFPAGTYKSSQTLDFRGATKAFSLRGPQCGKHYQAQQARLVYSGTATGDTGGLLNFNGCSGFEVAYLGLDYSNASFTGDLVNVDGRGTGVFQDCQDFHFHHCGSQGTVGQPARSIIRLAAAIIGTIDNCHFTGALNEVRVGDPGGYFVVAVQIDKCTFNFSRDAHILLATTDGEAIQIRDNTFEAGTNTPGIRGATAAADGTGVGLYSPVISGNWFGDAVSDTIWCKDLAVTSNNFMGVLGPGNRFASPGSGAGTCFKGTGYWLVVGNTFDGGKALDSSATLHPIAIGNFFNGTVNWLPLDAGIGNMSTDTNLPVNYNSTFARFAITGDTGADLGTRKTNEELVLGTSGGLIAQGGAGAVYRIKSGGNPFATVVQSPSDVSTREVQLVAGTTPAAVVRVAQASVGFQGTAPIAKPTVTGSRGGNAALASLLTALANYGLITDSTTA